MIRIEQLPIEIWDLILSFIPNSSLESTTRTLIDLFSSTIPISRSNLFKHLIIQDDHQLKNLLDLTILKHQNDHHLLVHHPLDLSTISISLSLRSWRLKDNYILINIINYLQSNLRFIELFIGPLFGPDQLEELFVNPKPNLEILSLRFNQNVSRRSYEPFLKGAYFDNCCDLLAKWPESNRFHSLSFVQDPLPPYQKSIVFNDRIAQPIILFRFWCITNLATSPLGRNILNLRLRIPNRNLAIPLTNNTTHVEAIDISDHLQFKLPIDPFPKLKFLDLSTSFLPSIAHDGLAVILKRFPRLEHLIIDRTQLILPSRFIGDEERVNESLRSIGSTVASIGISRAVELTRLWRDLYKVIEAELKREKIVSNGLNHHHDFPPAQTAPQPNSLPISRRRGRSSYASPPRLKTTTTAMTSSALSTSASSPSLATIKNKRSTNLALSQQSIPSKLIIIPSPSHLLSLCCGTELGSSSSNEGKRVQEEKEEELEIRKSWEDEFQKGWQIGLKKYEETVFEKLVDWDRTIEAWRKSMAGLLDSTHDTGPGSFTKSRKAFGRSSEERESEYQRLIKSKPMMMMMDMEAEEKGSKKKGTDEEEEEEDEDEPVEVFEVFKRRMRLKEVTVTEVEEILKGGQGLDGQPSQSAGPCFCSLNDCHGVGHVAWSFTDEKDQPVELLKRPDSDQLSLAFSHLALAPTLASHPRSDLPFVQLLPHPPRCGHLLARKLWHLDSW